MVRTIRNGIIALIAVFCIIICPTGNSEIQSDAFSSKSWDELLEIQSQLIDAFHASDGWQEVTVPAGNYRIGTDIPAGRWNMRVSEGSTAFVSLGTAYQDDNVSLAYPYGDEQISLNDSSFPGITLSELIWDFTDGCYFIVENAPVVFTPEIGAPFASFCNDLPTMNDTNTTGNDYKDKTGDDLLSLQRQRTSAMWESDGWEQVKIAAGVYEVGVDIPEGRWMMHAQEGDTSFVYLGKTLEDNNVEVAYPYTNEQIGKNDHNFPDVALSSLSWDLTKGMYLVISDAPVTFTRVSGSSLGFKENFEQKSTVTPNVPEATVEPTSTPKPTSGTYTQQECAEIAVAYMTEHLTPNLKNPASLQITSITGGITDNGEYLFAINFTAMNSFGGYTPGTYYCKVNYTTGEVTMGGMI